MTRPFEKVFIPNRGEIAVRAIRTLRELDIRSVVGHSACDRNSLAVRMADEARLLGPSPSCMSYLDPVRIVRAARETGCDALFPGYGFLSESADLARRCEEAGITFIGPPARVLRHLGQKDIARRELSDAGFRVVPGTSTVRGPEDIREFAEEVGYPVMIKPIAGAGGLGTVRVDGPGAIADALDRARNVAAIALGDDAVLVEKRIEDASAISIQFLVDRQGNAIHLGDRDGSVQRSYGKLMDEAPSSKLDAATRESMGTRVARAMAELGYVGAGTVEFLHEPGGAMFAIEVNPRIQVEHVVTEMILDVDIVEQMVRIAAGEPLTLRQEDITFDRHAIQCRIKAEDPRLGFSPTHGRVSFLQIADGPHLRHDDGIYQGSEIPMYYDSLLLKLAAVGSDRHEAIEHMAAALGAFRMRGVKTTAPLCLRILDHHDFLDGTYDAAFLERNLAELLDGNVRQTASKMTGTTARIPHPLHH